MSNLVIGGGLSGLSAAYYLAKTLPSQTTRLIESSQRLGGWIKTTKENNIIFEQAARTIRPRGEAGANTLDLIEELDLEDEIVPIFSDSPAAKNRMLYCDGYSVRD
ncbi:protoporphyrinogen oxidase [Cylas formicarius]|uniref:protoporphyrinogen oxidase n=1 Tax=Cylas formicarius TaxID=197179 RepID=UPI002958C770|nr:protoporphyrinogen oxidase [Cylas formicarius]